MLFSGHVLVLPRNGLFISDLPTLTRHLWTCPMRKVISSCSWPSEPRLVAGSTWQTLLPKQCNASGHRNVAVPSCHLIFGFAPGASAAKQLMAFSGCRWDLFCSWALALTAPLAESKVAALASEWGQPLLQQAGSLEGSCAGRAQGCFDRARMDTSCWLSEIGRATKILL